MPGFFIKMNPDEQAFNTTTLSIRPKVAKPIYTYTWDVESFLGENFNSGKFQTEVYLKDVNLPDITFEEEKVKGSSLSYKFAKEPSWSDVKITFYDTDGLLDVLHQMRSKIWNQKEGIRPAVEYKRDTRIIQYLADDITPAFTWVMYGSWLKGISSSQLTYTSSDMHNVIITISYDWAELISSGGYKNSTSASTS